MFLSLSPRHTGVSTGLTPEQALLQSTRKPQVQFQGGSPKADYHPQPVDQLTLSTAKAQASALNPQPQSVDSTPLLEAVAVGDLDSAKALLEADSDILAITPQGITPLVLAVGRENVPMTQLLLNNGAPLHSYYNNVPLLHMAVQTGNVDILKTLIDAGTDVNQQDNNKRTPLHIAADHDKPEVIAWLLANGAELEAQDNQGNTPLQHAVQNGHEQAYVALQKVGANLNSRNQLGLTPYLTAAGAGRVRLMKALQSNGAETKALTGQGLPALHWAAGLNQVEVLRHLLSPKHKAGPEIDLNKTAGTLDYTPLHLAVAFQSEDAIDELLKERKGKDPKKSPHPADWHLKDKSGASAWDYAQDHGPAFINRWRSSAEPNYKAEVAPAIPLKAISKAADKQPIQTTPLQNSHTPPKPTAQNPFIQKDLNGIKEEPSSCGSQSSKTKAKKPSTEQPETEVSPPPALSKAGKHKKKKQQATAPVNPAMKELDELDEALRAVYGVQSVKQSTKQYNTFLDFLNDQDETLGKLDIKGKLDLLSKHLNGLNINKPYEILVTTTADPTNPKPIRVTPLHTAILNPMPVEFIRLFMEKGADPSIKDSIGRTPFHLAALSGEVDYLNTLAGKKKGIFQSQNIDDWKNIIGNTPLHDAVRSGHLDAAEWLLNKKFPVNLKNQNGETALHVATNNGYPAIISLLLKHGANLETKNCSERTPLHLAAMNGDLEALKMLAKAGKKTFPLKNIDSWKSLDGNTPLHEAAKWGQLEVAEWLLDQQFPINTPNQNEDTPLHLAAGGGHPELVELLLKKGANANVKAKMGMTPVHSATHNMASEALEVLLKHTEIDPNAGLTNGSPALHMAVFNQDLKCTQLLLSNGANVNQVDNTGRGALQLAVVMNDPAMVSELLKQGADPTQQDNEGENVLHHLLCSQKYDKPEQMLTVLNTILKNVPPEIAQKMVNTQDSRFQNTPLHVAVALGNVEVAKQLLAYDANPSLANCAGKNALMLAIDNHNSSVVSELINILLKQPDATVQAMMAGKTKDEGANALHLATALNLSEAMDSLIRKQKELIAKGMPPDLFDLNEQDVLGNTPLHYATKLGSLKALRFLLKENVDLNQTNDYGRSPLMEAIVHKAKGNSTEALRASDTMVDEILSAARSKAVDAEQPQHAKVASLINQSDFTGSTALHLAAQLGKLPIFKKLLQQGGDARLLNLYGGSPLHVAADFENPEISQQMVESLLEVYNREGGAPLVREMVQLADQSGVTPLLVASTLQRPALEKRMRTYTHGSAPVSNFPPALPRLPQPPGEKRKVVKVPFYAC